MDLRPTPYSHFHGKSLGKILHHLHKCCTLDVAERAIFHERNEDSFWIEYLGQPFADGRWISSNGLQQRFIPIFTFHNHPFATLKQVELLAMMLVEGVEVR